jgi:hypothetical protein
MGLMTKPAHIGKAREDPNTVVGRVHRDPGTVKADRINLSIASARRAEILVVPSPLWIIAMGGNSLLRRPKAPKLQ